MIKLLNKQHHIAAGAAFLLVLSLLIPITRVQADEWDHHFVGTGSEFITFRSELGFYVYDDEADPGHTNPLGIIDMIPEKPRQKEGNYYLEYEGVKFMFYDNAGDACHLNFPQENESILYEYLYNDRQFGGRKSYYLLGRSVIKIYSRDKNHVGPYNYNDGNYWTTKHDLLMADYGVLCRASQGGRDKYGNLLDGYYNLNGDQINSIDEIFADPYRIEVSAVGSSKNITYDANGGTIKGKARYKTTFTVGNDRCINDKPTYNSYHFWGWSTKRYGINPNLGDEDLIRGGDRLEFWEDATLYAVWGTYEFGDVIAGHTHRFRVKIYEKNERCPICNGMLYKYVDECDCGLYYDRDDVDHECPACSIHYSNGICRTCGRYHSDQGSKTIEGRNQEIVALSDTGLTYPGHHFVGWNDSMAGNGTWYSAGQTYSFESYGEDKTIYAIWEPNNYRLTFDYMETGLLGADTMTKGETQRTVSYDALMNDLPEPTLNGFAFNGWYSPDRGVIMSDSMRYGIAHDATFEAEWLSHAVTVFTDPAFPDDALTTEMPEFFTLMHNVFEVGYGTYYGKWIPTGLTPKCFGYDFVGWTDANGVPINENTLCTIDDAHTIYGSWRKKNIQLTLDPGFGAFSGKEAEEPVITTREYGTIIIDEYALPTPERKGYQFTGWFTERDGNGEKTENGDKLLLNGNTTFYAGWQKKKYAVTFDYCTEWKYPATDLQGNDTEYLIVTYDEYPGELPTPARFGYKFTGWSTDKKYYPEYDAYNGDPDADVISKEALWDIDGNVTVYALWQALTVKVTYDYNYDYTEKIPLP